MSRSKYKSFVRRSPEREVRLRLRFDSRFRLSGEKSLRILFVLVSSSTERRGGYYENAVAIVQHLLTSSWVNIAKFCSEFAGCRLSAVLRVFVIQSAVYRPHFDTT